MKVGALVRKYINRQLFDLQLLEYGHDGDGGLPARPDAVSTAVSVLCGYKGRDLPLDLLREPVVSLRHDGTIEVTWFEGPAGLSFVFPCRDILIAERHLGESVTRNTHSGHAGGDEIHGRCMEDMHWLAAHAGREAR